MMKDKLNELCEAELKVLLKTLYREKSTLTVEDRDALKKFETQSFALLGIIGLLIDSEARILLGKKQPYDMEVQNWCMQVDVPYEYLKKVADQYLDDDYSEESEFILRKVMLNYPNER